MLEIKKAYNDATVTGTVRDVQPIEDVAKQIARQVRIADTLKNMNAVWVHYPRIVSDLFFGRTEPDEITLSYLQEFADFAKSDHLAFDFVDEYTVTELQYLYQVVFEHLHPGVTE